MKLRLIIRTCRHIRPDGRHFTPAAAAIESQWLLPQVVTAVPK